MSSHLPRTRLALLGLLSIALSSPAWAGTEITYRGFVKEMRGRGIDAKHVTDESVAHSLDALSESIETRIHELAKDEHPEGKQALLRTLLERLKSASGRSAPDRRAAYVAALRGLYSVEAEPFEDSHGFGNWLRMQCKAPGRLFTRAPRLTPEVLGMTHAEYVRDRRPGNAAEAEGLVDERGVRLGASSLENMTIAQIADLDVPADHPTWLREADRRRTADTAWDDMERRVERLVDASKTFAKARRPSSASYHLEAARRVLFLDELRKSGTAPKLDARDAFGLGWKVKLSNQSQPEPIASHLFVLLGQKFVDLVYSNGRGGRELVLILPAAGRKPAGDGSPCEAPSDLEQLTTCFRKGRYHFDLTPYVATSGTITALEGDRLAGSAGDDLAALPAGSKLGADDVVGRVYVTFRESEVEFQGHRDVYSRVGPVAKNFAGAGDDRGERAGLVANMWVNNFDAKDENSKTVVVPAEDGRGDDPGRQDVFEIYHDLGGTLGDQSGGFGRIDKLKTGERFLAVGRKNLKFRQFLLYRPRAWTEMTAADGLWMARKIASLTEVQIEGAVAHARLPEFVRQVYVYKLKDRRDQIARAYGLPLPDRTAAPTIDLDLSPSHRAAVARELGLDPGILEEAIASAERKGFRGPLDHVVVDGQLSACQDSVVIGLLESESYPSGLTRRTKSFKDDHPLPRCRYGVRPRKQ